LHYDALVIGAGAAGLFAAIEAGKRGKRVAVLEHNDRIGRKILISGGGRCNFTNIHTRPENFLSVNPHFCKSALARYTPEDFVELVRKHRIAYHEKTLGQLFCDDSATDIIRMLEAECRADIVLGCRVDEVRRTDQFLVTTSKGEYTAPAVVIATGGLSIPKIGATDFGYRVARQFGHKIHETRPALVPFVAEDAFTDLSGVSLEVVASANGGPPFREKMLFTHRGLSGPAILQASSYWRKGEPVRMDLLPGRTLNLLKRKKAGDRAELKNVLAEFLPKRLAERWPAPPKPLLVASDRELADLEAKLHDWQIVPSGTEGYAKAEVTAGGVDTNELSSKTMESRKVPGLYFVGEVVDVTGHLGGFNFQWAWASGFCAGQAL
jgi:predicted Rossmann fold flavoprotein